MTSKSHISLWIMFAQSCNLHHRSLLFAMTNSKAKGPLFHTNQLPQLAKSLDLALEVGYLDLSTTFFKKRSNKSKLPSFMYELFIKIFFDDGYIREDACPVAIRDIRQLCYLHYKFISDFSDETRDEAYKKFISTDMLVQDQFSDIQIDSIKSDFRSLLPDNPMDIRCRHSNGATADKFNNIDRKYTKRSLPLTRELSFLFFNTHTHAEAWMRSNKIIKANPTSRFTLVPKDSRGPRGICIEPHEHMFVQQGLMQKLYDHIESISPAKGYINFTDQGTNQKLAYLGSIDRSYCTIDLKDASDMVSWALVQQLLPDDWLHVVTMCRSAIVSVNGTIIELKKFAPMGSALCFPIEAMIFWSICRTITDRVWVYGDDIIVHNENYERVVKALESYGLIINRDKSLHQGFFRESCGSEYYRGHDISYVKCKSYDLENYIAFANNVSYAYNQKLADNIVKLYEEHTSLIMYREPISNRSRTQTLVYYTNDCCSSHVFFKRKWCKDLQRYYIRRLSLVPKTDKSTRTCLSDGYDDLYLWLLGKCSSSPIEDKIWSLTPSYLRDFSIIDVDQYTIAHSRKRINLPGAPSALTGIVKTRIKFTWASFEVVL